MTSEDVSDLGVFLWPFNAEPGFQRVWTSMPPVRPTANNEGVDGPSNVNQQKRWIMRHAAISFLATLLALGPATYSQSLDELTRYRSAQAFRASSSNPDLNSNGDDRSIAPGETLVLGELEGPGVIAHVWATVGSPDPFYGRSLVLRIYWDGAQKPSVEVPFGDFFGVGHGARVDFVSLPVSASSHGRAVNCFWKMPFRKSAKITVTNESAVYPTPSFYYQIDWRKVDRLPEDVLYFHARYRQAAPAEPGDYTILETQGKGQYVGTVYSVLQTETGWFGEGDERFYIDGDSLPRLRGTGTEDYFGDAWGFRTFSALFYGVPLWEGYFPGDRVSAYRWHIIDPVPFETSLKVTIEHRGSIYTDAGQHLGQFIERPDWISSVALWYQWPARTFEDRLPPLEERLPPWRALPATKLQVHATPERGLAKTEIGVDYSPGVPDAKIAFDFEVAESGRYRLDAIITYSVFGSRYQPFLDGKPLGPELDLCISGHDPLWVRFDLHDLEAGKHTLSFVGRGASARKRTMAPAAYYIGVNYLLLLRMEDVEGYHGALNAIQNSSAPNRMGATR